MKRDQAERVASKIVEAQIAMEGNRQAQGGIRLVALMIAEIAAENGTIEKETFLRRCGIEPKTFRKKPHFTYEERFEEMRSGGT